MTNENGYVRVAATRLAALENMERELHEMKMQLQQQEMAKANAQFLQDQIVPDEETPLEVIAAAMRSGEIQTRKQAKRNQYALRDVDPYEFAPDNETAPSRTFPPPQTLDDTLPDAERDADELLNALESAPEQAKRTSLTKMFPESPEARANKERERLRTDAERHTHAETMRATPYGDIFATVLEMIQRDGTVILQTKLLTPGNVQTVMEAIETGMSRKGACGLVGITNATLQRYKRMADEEEPQEPFASFIQLLEMAEARAEATLIGRWQRHTAESWQASKALLEKRFRNEWGDKQQVELQLDQLLKMSPEQLLEIMGPEARATIVELEKADDGSFG